MAFSNRPENKSPEIMASIDAQLEDHWYDRVESFVREELALCPNLSENWISLPSKLRHLLEDVIELMPESFLADAISTAIGLSLAAWEDYVTRYGNELGPSSLLTALRSRPKLQEFLFAFQWPAAILESYPGLARNELDERVCRGEGSSPRAYARQFGVKLRQPTYESFVRVQACNRTIGSNNLTFPLYGQVSVGRRRIHSSEPSPICFIEGDIEHRLVIADFQQVEESSREQLRMNVLTPSNVVVENVSSMIDVDIVTQPAMECPESLAFVPKAETAFRLDCGQSITVRLPAKIVLPGHTLSLYRA